LTYLRPIISFLITTNAFPDEETNEGARSLFLEELRCFAWAVDVQQLTDGRLDSDFLVVRKRNLSNQPHLSEHWADQVLEIAQNVVRPGARRPRLKAVWRFEVLLCARHICLIGTI
jgi:hypothetical protein